MSVSKNKSFSQREKCAIREVTTYLAELKSIASDICIFPKSPTVDQLCAKLNTVAATVAKLFNTSARTIQRINNEHDNENQRAIRPQNTPIQISAFEISKIRRTTLDFYGRREYPTLQNIKSKCEEDVNFPRVGKETFRKWMLKDCHFKFQRMNKKPVYLEKENVAIQRAKYLRTKRKLQADGYTIIFHDETWANANQSPNKAWLCLLNKLELNELRDNTNQEILHDMKGFAGGFLVKGGEGRIIINHAGCETGFIEGDGVQDVFVSNSRNADYHSSMNSEHFIHWFENFLKHVPHKSVIIMDQAPYHKKRVDSTVMAKLYWKKEQIIANLQLRHIPVPEDVDTFWELTKRELISLSDEYPVGTKYVVEEMAENCGKDVKVLWLPVAHCEFNAIELIWAFVKRYVAKNNKEGGIKNMLNLTLEALKSVTPKLWKSCCDHVLKYENEMWQRDNLVEENFYENLTEPIQNPGDPDSESTTESDSD